jgi:opine dehydrogenase
VIHPAVSLLNVGRIESPSDFLFYEEGVTPAAGLLMEAVDKERMAIAQGFGLEILSEPETGYQQGYMLEKNYTTGYSKAPGGEKNIRNHGVKLKESIEVMFCEKEINTALLKNY